MTKQRILKAVTKAIDQIENYNAGKGQLAEAYDTLRKIELGDKDYIDSIKEAREEYKEGKTADMGQLRKFLKE